MLFILFFFLLNLFFKNKLHVARCWHNAALEFETEYTNTGTGTYLVNYCSNSIFATSVIFASLWRVLHTLIRLTPWVRSIGVPVLSSRYSPSPTRCIVCNVQSYSGARCCTPAIYQLFIAASTFAKYYSAWSRDSQISLLHVYTVLRVDVKREKNIPALSEENRLLKVIPGEKAG